jgi:hypothetical protein
LSIRTSQRVLSVSFSARDRNPDIPEAESFPPFYLTISTFFEIFLDIGKNHTIMGHTIMGHACMCRFRYAITESDAKVLGALAEIIPGLAGATDAAILGHLSGLYQNNQGLTAVPIQFPSSLMTQTIEFYDIEIERLTVVPKHTLPKRDCYSLKGPNEFTDVSQILDAIEQIDHEFRDKVELSRYGDTFLVSKEKINDLVVLANEVLTEHKQKIHEMKTMDISVMIQEYKRDQDQTIDRIKETTGS